MKKALTVLISICLVFALCVSSFAIDLGPTSDTVSKVTSAVSGITDSSSEEDVKKAADSVLDILKKAGVKTKEDAADAAEQLYNDVVIEKNVYDALKKAIDTDESFGEATKAESDIINEITSIINDDSIGTTDKVTKIASKLAGLPAEEIQKILDTLHDNGTLDDDMYSKISDAINNISIDKISDIIPGGGAGGGIVDLLGGIGGGDSPISGILSTVMGLLGLGGGDEGGEKKSNSGSSSGSGSSSSGGSSSSSFQGKTAKTGDYTVASVAGLALLAGAAFVLTRKKREE
ncbi:MAG: LPXTG cell wall anchor domain-containing protein [Ruminococcaceae bacterium]|nr:LPXTG cell wall anchor domain-containing protein [Oscillospiraceae bacterium]